MMAWIVAIIATFVVFVIGGTNIVKLGVLQTEVLAFFGSQVGEQDESDLFMKGINALILLFVLANLIIVSFWLLIDKLRKKYLKKQPR